MLEKEHGLSVKALEKMEKTSNELLRERDTIHKELKKTESMAFVSIFCRRILIRN